MSARTWLFLAGLVLAISLLAAWATASNADTSLGVCAPPTGTSNPVLERTSEQEGCR